MTVEQFLSQYGWVGILIWLVAERVLPFVRDAIMPAANKRAERETIAIEKISDAVATLATAYSSQSKTIDCIADDTTVTRDGVKTLLERTAPPPVKARGMT